MVIELPPGPLICAAINLNQRWVADMGVPGPDAGNGGKHLLLPPGWDGEVPEGYYVARSTPQGRCTRVASPSTKTAATASRRTSSDTGGVPPCPGRRGGRRCARRPASQASTCAGSDERAQSDKGTRPPGRREHLPMV
jgi:hypothetical protein